MNPFLTVPRIVVGTLDVALTFASAFLLPDGGQRVARRNAASALSRAAFQSFLNSEATRSLGTDHGAESTRRFVTGVA